MNKKIFVTGSSGFVGSYLLKKLAKYPYETVAGTRSLYGDMDKQNKWENYFVGVDVIIHLAARVHCLTDESTNSIDEYRKANTETTLKIAKSAMKMGVRRFIFLSTVKVNGELTFDHAFKSSDISAPLDPYGISKMEAENELLKLHQDGVFEVVIIRPPLVYGIGAKANLDKLIKLVGSRIPLPFGLVSNKRSMVSVLNLVDLILICINHPNASGKIFLVSDDNDYSLKEIILNIGKLKNIKTILIPIPSSFLKTLFNLFGKKDYADRLFGNLQVDITETKKLLDWNPKHTFLSTYKKD